MNKELRITLNGEPLLAQEISQTNAIVEQQNAQYPPESSMLANVGAVTVLGAITLGVAALAHHENSRHQK